MQVLDNIPLSLNLEAVFNKSQLPKENKLFKKTVEELIEIVNPVASPKAIYEVAYIDDRNEDSLYINGVKFTSRVLRVNLDKVERVFPHVVTCGKELDEIAVPPDDIMKNYCLDAIKEAVLKSALHYLENHLTKCYALGQISTMHPGSLEDWPITQQKELFSLFASTEELIGVKLTENCLMIPIKSLSGIYFPTEIKFESCQLCQREGCSTRRASYDPDLARKYREAI